MSTCDIILWFCDLFMSTCNMCVNTNLALCSEEKNTFRKKLMFFFIHLESTSLFVFYHACRIFIWSVHFCIFSYSLFFIRLLRNVFLFCNFNIFCMYTIFVNSELLENLWSQSTLQKRPIMQQLTSHIFFEI